MTRSAARQQRPAIVAVDIANDPNINDLLRDTRRTSGRRAIVTPPENVAQILHEALTRFIEQRDATAAGILYSMVTGRWGRSHLRGLNRVLGVEGVEDIQAEVALKILDAPRTYLQSTPPKTASYIKKTLIFRGRDVLRARKVRIPMEHVVKGENPRSEDEDLSNLVLRENNPEPPLEPLIDREIVAKIEAILDEWNATGGLARERRALVIRLHGMEGLETEEIAEHPRYVALLQERKDAGEKNAGWHIGMVRTDLSRGMKLLRQTMEKRGLLLSRPTPLLRPVE
ncbi:MAG: hypothetical protein ABIK09_13390 [Pseudomonadota bacterium]